MKSYGVTTQIKATEQHFPVVLFTMLCKENLPFESVKRHPLMCSRTLPPTKEKRREGTPSVLERSALLGLNADMDVTGLPLGLFASEHIFRATNLNLTLLYI